MSQSREKKVNSMMKKPLSMTFHGTLMDIHGLGVLLKGDSFSGKSEVALSLVDRGHRLISDDAVYIVKKDNYLEGKGKDEQLRYHMEIRGIGIINIAQLFGIKSVRESFKIDLVIELEMFDSKQSEDPLGLKEKYCDILGIQLPYYPLPVNPGRNIALLLETITLNQRLKNAGWHTAIEFRNKLLRKGRREEKLERLK